jgi:hypothetical protein
MGGGGSLLGFGGGAAGGASQGITDISSMATPLETTLGTVSEQLAPNAFGGVGIDLGNLGYNATEGANLLGNMGTGITQTANPLMNMTASGGISSGMPTLMDKIANAPSAAFEFMKSNPSTTLAAGTKLYDYSNQQQPLVTAPNAGVNRGKGAVDYQPLLNIEIPKQKYPHSLLLG